MRIRAPRFVMLTKLSPEALKRPGVVTDLNKQVEDQKAPKKHLHLVHKSHKPKSKTAVQIITHLSGIN
jgi:hypothetical protein